MSDLNATQRNVVMKFRRNFSEHIPGDVVIALKNLQRRCEEHQMDVAVCAFLKRVEDAVQVMVLWPLVTEQNAELKEMVRDALSRD